jgi:hypothetical protein
VFWVGWKCSSGRRSEVPPRRRRVNQSAMPCPAFPQPSAFAWQTGRCRVRSSHSASPRLLPVSSSLWQFPTRASDRVPVRLCCLLRRRSFGVCAARLNAATKHCNQSNALCPTNVSGASGGLLLRKSLERGVRVVIRMHEA